MEQLEKFNGSYRLEFAFDPFKSTWQTIHDLLSAALVGDKEGPVAYYLVGAILQIRFSEIEIGNESYSTADDQLGRHGDFFIGDTVFHITVAPMPAVFTKCKKNIKSGFRAFLLVPDNMLAGARQNSEMVVPGQIAVESIESFVSQNIEELSKFSKPKLLSGLRKLLETYNERVNSAEIDKSMLIEIPRGLL